MMSHTSGSLRSCTDSTNLRPVATTQILLAYFMDNLNQIQVHTFYHDNAKAKFSQKRKPRGNPKIYYSLRYDIFESLLMNDYIERLRLWFIFELSTFLHDNEKNSKHGDRQWLR